MFLRQLHRAPQAVAPPEPSPAPTSDLAGAPQGGGQAGPDGAPAPAPSEKGRRVTGLADLGGSIVTGRHLRTHRACRTRHVHQAHLSAWTMLSGERCMTSPRPSN